VQALRIRLYVLLINRLYVDGLHNRLGQGILRVAHGLDKRLIGRPW
jgi:hypothetical protein